jgi:iron(III) transport system substrate-binding protein
MQKLIIIALMCAILGLPFLFRERQEGLGDAQDRIIVVSPHGENIRREFGDAFRRWYFEETGRTIRVDWRVLGGTSEIARFINATYLNNFRNYWESTRGESWNSTVQAAFHNPRIVLPADPADDDLGQRARRAFLESDVGIGIDVFFGGGAYDFIRQADLGNLKPFDTPEGMRARFPDHILPQTYAGEPFWDPQGRWMGAVLSTFGIVFNRDSLRRLGVENDPTRWVDLTDPRLVGQVVLADPTKSGSSNKAFEMIIQQEMQNLLSELEADPANAGADLAALEARAIREGWLRGMSIIQQISANARFFTDVSTQPAIDVASGDSAAGMSIDFFGRFQAEITAQRGDPDRFDFISPQGGSTVSVDPIAIMRGPPNPGIAQLFVEFVMSEEGQKLWAFRPSAPGGPRTFALRRSPAIRTLYNNEAIREFLSDPDVDPYRDAGDFVYRPEWTGALFNPLRFLIRTAFIDPADELRHAWRAIQRAKADGRTEDAERALAIFSDLSVIEFDRASTEINQILRSADRIEEVRLSRDLSQHFRRQYQLARRLAEGRSGN